MDPFDTNDLLRGRIDALEVAAKERNRPWYRQPAVIMSIIAMVISTIGTYLAQRHTNAESIRSQKEELRRLALSLIELRAEGTKLAPGDGGQILTAKQGVYLQAADRLVGQLGDNVSPYEYTILAIEHDTQGDKRSAEKYFQQAARLAQSPTVQADAYRALAMFHAAPGSSRDFKKARAMLGKGIEAVDSSPDPSSMRTKCHTYGVWATIERQARQEDQARKREDEAKKCMAALSSDAGTSTNATPSVELLPRKQDGEIYDILFEGSPRTTGVLLKEKGTFNDAQLYVYDAGHFSMLYIPVTTTTGSDGIRLVSIQWARDLAQQTGRNPRPTLVWGFERESAESFEGSHSELGRPPLRFSARLAKR